MAFAHLVKKVPNSNEKVFTDPPGGRPTYCWLTGRPPPYVSLNYCCMIAASAASPGFFLSAFLKHEKSKKFQKPEFSEF